MSRRIATALVAIGAAIAFAPPAPAQQMSNRCVTPQFWCILPAAAPVGTPCYCSTPYGRVAGVIR
jgi:hypothetical protein